MARAAKKKKTPAKAKAIKKPAKKAAKKAVAKAAKKPAKKILKLKPKAAAKPAPKAKAAAPAPAVKSGKVDVGAQAPNFKMAATRIGEVSRDSLKGKPYVLYFYPKDDTSGCTAEACEFRNTMPAFDKLGITVIGVSKDGLESHDKFSRKYNLNFPLASDENNVCEAFGTWAQKSMYGRSYMGIERSTFLVDSKGVIRAQWRKVSVSGHVEEVKKAVENL
ncbi:MAG TPA: peroxiredoxin [Alphaproteobacteria bacterium]|nr:peroxiredoxin [Alphaproteobacteria bacterium]